MAAEANERVMGYMYYGLHKDWIHLFNFAVHPDFRRRGIGRQMIEKCISKLAKERRNRILLEVPETNLPAQLFFRSLGFRTILVPHDSYEKTIEDAYLMEYRLG